MAGDLFLGPVFGKLLVNPVEHRRLLNEFSGCVDVQKDTVSEQAGLCQVAGPHFQIMLGDLDPFVLLEILR